ncbi:MAG TPA: AAA family ATPase [Steroidobacteraceae bacterium]|nr:AAA family ATPase [Steroidobacteraceae bacterium]
MNALPEQLQALRYPRAYPHAVRAVDLLETHISWVLLTGRFAYKIKRPVHYPFIDLRRSAQRRRLCYEEVRLNRRFAPELYLGVSTVRLRHGEAHIGGSGRIIEYAVRMRQFPRAQELGTLLDERRIEPVELEHFGRELARLHARLPAARARQRWGHPKAQIESMRRNAREAVRAAQTLGKPAAAAVRAVQARLERWMGTARPLLEQRFAARRVRECHGDLHAGNIVRHGAGLTPFDCLEFDPALRWIDAADEVAFLLMDLEARERPLHAQAFLGGYLSASGDYQSCLLLPLFRAHRALVRAKVMALNAAASGTTGLAARKARRDHERYVECAHQALALQRPKLVLMSGLSGSGKTWLAQRLAPALRAVHLRSDIERKRLAGLPALARSGSALGKGLYARGATRAVYDRLAQCAADALAGGCTTIVDATFGQSADRARFRALAAGLGIDTWVVYCHAARETLEARIHERHERANDPSEADIRVLDWQEAHFTPPAPREGITVLDAARLAPRKIVSRISGRIRAGTPRLLPIHRKPPPAHDATTT